MTRKLTNTLPPLVLPAETTNAEIRRRLEDYAYHYRGVYSENTERAIRADLRVFATWAVHHGQVPLPATVSVLVAFIDAMTGRRKPQTVSRYVSSIRKIHRAARVEPNPCDHEYVDAALKRLRRDPGSSARQSQQKPINHCHVKTMLAAIDALPETLKTLRDAMLIAIAYDTGCRAAELVALDVGDVSVNPEDGSGICLVRRSKTDQEGEGHARYLRPDTVLRIEAWVENSGVKDSRLIRGLIEIDSVRDYEGDATMAPRSISRIFKARMQAAGLDATKISAHSTRIGANQDMTAADIGTGAIMQALGYKTPRMPARYAEHLHVARGAAARLAALQEGD